MATGQLAPAQVRQHLRLRGVPVFVYHGLINSEDIEAPSRERKYWILEKRFREHLNQIRRGGFRVRRLGELWNGGRGTPSTACRDRWRAPTVVLTFDDGLASHYQVAYPALLEADVRADFFVNTATVGGRRFLSWGQVAEMQRAGMSFQSHSHDHVYLTWLPVGTLERQLRDSKCRLEDRLGHSVDFLSVPYGDLNDRVLEVARQVGYQAVCNSRSWPARPCARTVNRVVVYRHTTPHDFLQLLVGDPVCYAARAARETFMYFPKRLLLRFWPSPPPHGHLTAAEGK